MWTAEGDEFQLVVWYIHSYKPSTRTISSTNISVLSTNPLVLSRADPSLAHLFPLLNNLPHLHRNRFKQALSHFTMFASLSLDQNFILVHQ